MRNFFLLIIFIFSLQTAYAQKSLAERGRLVLASDTTEGIGYAHVHNKRTGVTVVSSVNGYFMLRDRTLQDSLAIRVIGYYDTTLTVAQFHAGKNQIPLTEKVYQLNQVNVTADRLTQSFAPTTRSSEPYMGHGSVRASGRSRNAKFSYGKPSVTNTETARTGFGSGIGALAAKYNKDYQQRARLAEVKDEARLQAEFQALYEKWFSVSKLKELTALESPLAEKFKAYLTPAREFLLSASEYDIITYILEQLKTFQASEN